MGSFLFAAAALVAATLLLLWRPWQRSAAHAAGTTRELNARIYRDQLLELDRDLAAGTISAADHAQSRAELQRRVLDDTSLTEPSAGSTSSSRLTLWLIALALPLAAGGLYSWLGTPAALDPRATHVVTRSEVEKMVAELAERVAKNPSDSKGWVVLARSYRVMGRLPEAQTAFEHIGEALNQSPVLLTEYADVLATRAMGNFDGKPAALIAQALQLDPENVIAMSLAATAAYNRGDVAQAIAHWEHLQRLVPPESDDAKWLAQALAKVRAQVGTMPAAQAIASTKPAGTGASVSGRVSLASALRDKVQPGDTVFVFARATQGPRMPLAVQRAHVSDLPLDFKLDDSMAMSPALKLSSFAELRVEARVSRSGSATPAAGDLIGTGPVVKPGASQIAVQIDQLRD